MNLDLINSVFALCAGIICWTNVSKLYDDKKVVGVRWQVQAFFAAWGYWHLYYFSQLEQWFTVFAGASITAGNTMWVAMAVYYVRKANCTTPSTPSHSDTA